MDNIFLVSEEYGHVCCFDKFDDFIKFLEEQKSVDFAIFNKDGTKLMRGTYDFSVNMDSYGCVEELFESLKDEDGYPYQKELLEYFEKRLEYLKVEEKKKEKAEKDKKEREEYELYLRLKAKYQKY